jgi:hypothetical protein
MKSHEVLKSAVNVVGTKQVAYSLKTSSSLIYKWCSAFNAEDPMGTTRNPLDRVLEIIECTGDRSPVEFLCGEIGGVFVESAQEELDGDLDAECVRHTQTLLSEFSELLQVISESMADVRGIDPREAASIREKWQRLQSQGESFVRACERGLFDPDS